MPRGIPKRAGQSDGQRITKWDAVGRALAELGKDAKPLQIRDFIRSHIGINMEPQLISNYKSAISKKAAKQSALIRKTAAPASRPTSTGGGITVEDIKAVKEVVERIGADKVRQLTEVLAK
ncbi:MAG TPA: hypothetical protein VKI65_01795 [Gemmataceae bacterium]|nr:hypothetical protein [Gemmataceae bacterium]